MGRSVRWCIHHHISETTRDTSVIHSIFCTRYIRPWLGPFLSTWRHVMHFRFCGCRHVSFHVMDQTATCCHRSSVVHGLTPLWRDNGLHPVLDDGGACQDYTDESFVRVGVWDLPFPCLNSHSKHRDTELGLVLENTHLFDNNNL